MSCSPTTALPRQISSQQVPRKPLNMTTAPQDQPRCCIRRWRDVPFAAGSASHDDAARLEAISGFFANARARLVSGASVIITSPGLASIASMIASAACTYQELSRRRIAVIAKPVAAMKPSRVFVSSKQRLLRARVDRTSAPQSSTV